MSILLKLIMKSSIVILNTHRDCPPYYLIKSPYLSSGTHTFIYTTPTIRIRNIDFDEDDFNYIKLDISQDKENIPPPPPLINKSPSRRHLLLMHK